MQRPQRNAPLLVILASLCLACPIAWAETGILVVHVKDVQRQPVVGLEIGVGGDGGSAITDPKGKARIKLAPQTKEKSSVALQIVKSPPGQSLVMVSPWDYRTQVPSFENETDNFVEVVVVQRGERAALESGTVLKAAVSQINKANAPKSADKQAAPEDPKANLNAVAKQFGLSPDKLDKAIKAWGAKTTDTYEAGLAALYARNYDKATTDLQTSLSHREEKLASDQKAVGDDQKQVADAALFLGQSLYQQGKYKESATALQRCLQIRPDDPTVLNNAATSLMLAGDYAGAEPLFRRALAINEKAQGTDHPLAATILANLGVLLRATGNDAGAEPLFRRALAIDEKALGPDHPDVARDLNNLAGLLRAKGDYAGADSPYRRALAIDEKALGPNDPGVAIDLSNLALLLEAHGDYEEAEALFRRALAIDEKARGPDHPLVAIRLNNLAELLEDKGGYAAAEPLLRRAVAIDKKALGSDHPDVAIDLNSLAGLLYAKGDYAAAVPLMRRAVAIDEEALGPDHPQTRGHKKNLDALLQKSAQAAAPKAKN